MGEAMRETESVNNSTIGDVLKKQDLELEPKAFPTGEGAAQEAFELSNAQGAPNGNASEVRELGSLFQKSSPGDAESDTVVASVENETKNVKVNAEGGSDSQEQESRDSSSGDGHDGDGGGIEKPKKRDLMQVAHDLSEKIADNQKVRAFSMTSEQGQKAVYVLAGDKYVLNPDITDENISRYVKGLETVPTFDDLRSAYHKRAQFDELEGALKERFGVDSIAELDLQYHEQESYMQDVLARGKDQGIEIARDELVQINDEVGQKASALNFIKTSYRSYVDQAQKLGLVANALVLADTAQKAHAQQELVADESVEQSGETNGAFGNIDAGYVNVAGGAFNYSYDNVNKVGKKQKEEDMVVETTADASTENEQDAEVSPEVAAVTQQLEKEETITDQLLADFDGLTPKDKNVLMQRVLGMGAFGAMLGGVLALRKKRKEAAPIGTEAHVKVFGKDGRFGDRKAQHVSVDVQTPENQALLNKIKAEIGLAWVGHGTLDVPLTEVPVTTLTYLHSDQRKWLKQYSDRMVRELGEEASMFHHSFDVANVAQYLVAVESMRKAKAGLADEMVTDEVREQLNMVQDADNSADEKFDAKMATLDDALEALTENQRKRFEEYIAQAQKEFGSQVHPGNFDGKTLRDYVLAVEVLRHPEEADETAKRVAAGALIGGATGVLAAALLSRRGAVDVPEGEQHPVLAEIDEYQKKQGETVREVNKARAAREMAEQISQQKSKEFYDVVYAFGKVAGLDDVRDLVRKMYSEDGLFAANGENGEPFYVTRADVLDYIDRFEGGEDLKDESQWDGDLRSALEQITGKNQDDQVNVQQQESSTDTGEGSADDARDRAETDAYEAELRNNMIDVKDFVQPAGADESIPTLEDAVVSGDESGESTGEQQLLKHLGVVDEDLELPLEQFLTIGGNEFAKKMGEVLNLMNANDRKILSPSQAVKEELSVGEYMESVALMLKERSINVSEVV